MCCSVEGPAAGAPACREPGFWSAGAMAVGRCVFAGLWAFQRLWSGHGGGCAAGRTAGTGLRKILILSAAC